MLKKAGFDENSKVESLAGDASTRKYYRVSSNDRNYVIMEDKQFINIDPNIACHKLFKDCGVRVPGFIRTFPQEGIIVEEDLGQTHLQDVRLKKQLDSYYKEAVANIIKYQKSFISTSFTKEKFLSELEMTLKYYVMMYKGKDVKDKKHIDAFCVDLVDKMMAQPQALLHRDYHSRNIMIKDSELVLIDFQDARMGPYAYDIASLTIDPYIDVDSDFRNSLIDDYYNGIKDIVKVTHQDYLKHYSLCYLQRGIKMLGTFSYQKIEKGKDTYLKYIPATVENIKTISKQFVDWQPLIEEIYIK